MTVADLKDLANLKRDLQAMAQQMQRGMTFADLKDLANLKRDLTMITPADAAHRPVVHPLPANPAKF